MTNPTAPVWWRHDFDQLLWAETELARLAALETATRTLTAPDGMVIEDFHGLTEGERDRRSSITGITIPFATKRLRDGAEMRPRAAILMTDGTFYPGTEAR